MTAFLCKKKRRAEILQKKKGIVRDNEVALCPEMYTLVHLSKKKGVRDVKVDPDMYTLVHLSMKKGVRDVKVELRSSHTH